MDTLLQIGLSNALAATLLAVPVALVARVGRRPALAHALWVLVLLKLVTPPLFAMPMPWPDPLAPGPQEIVPPVVTAGAAPGSQHFDLPPLAADPGDKEAAAVIAPHQGPPARRLVEPVPAPSPDGKFVLLALWLTGSALWWLVACLRVARFRQLLRHTTPAPADVQAQAMGLAERLGLKRCPGVWLVPARVSPLLWALGRVPRLLLPTDLLQALTPEQRDTLLAHELAHLRRRDHWVRRLELLALGLFWWHPVAWWARHELAEAEEACCDAWVLWALPEAGPAYAAALVETIAFLSPTRRPVPVAASGAGRVKTLKRRLTMILQRPSPRALSGAGLFAVLGLGGLLLPLLPTWAEQQAAETRGAPAPPAAEKAPAPPAAGEAPAAATTPPRPAAEVRLGIPPPRAETTVRRDQTEEIQKARDDVELLEAQMEIRRAHLEAAKAALANAKQNLSRHEELYRQGALSQSTLAQARAEVDKQEPAVPIKAAELRESEVRLAQGVRRLAALQRQAGGSVPTALKGNWAAALFEESVAGVNIPHGGKVIVRFGMMNTTKERVHLSSVRTSSAAVSATPTTNALAPGERGSVDVLVDGRRLDGAKTLEIFVEFDRPRKAQVRLQVRAVIGEAPPAAKTAPAGDLERLKALEDKLDRLLREVEELRKKIPPGGTKGARLNLDSQLPALDPFQVRVPRDGLYWFNVVTADPAGKQEPALKVLVQTKQG